MFEEYLKPFLLFLLEVRPKKVAKSYYLLCILLAWVVPIVAYGFLKADKYICLHYYGFCAIVCFILSILIAQTFSLNYANEKWYKSILFKTAHGIALFTIAAIMETSIIFPLSELFKTSHFQKSYLSFLSEESDCSSNFYLVVKPWMLKKEWEDKKKECEDKKKECEDKKKEIDQKDSLIKAHEECIFPPPPRLRYFMGTTESVIYSGTVYIDNEPYFFKLYNIDFNRAFIDSGIVNDCSINANIGIYALGNHTEYSAVDKQNRSEFYISALCDSCFFTGVGEPNIRLKLNLDVYGIDYVNISFNGIHPSNIKLDIGNNHKTHDLDKGEYDLYLSDTLKKDNTEEIKTVKHSISRGHTLNLLPSVDSTNLHSYKKKSIGLLSAGQHTTHPRRFFPRSDDLKVVP